MPGAWGGPEPRGPPQGKPPLRRGHDLRAGASERSARARSPQRLPAPRALHRERGTRGRGAQAAPSCPRQPAREPALRRLPGPARRGEAAAIAGHCGGRAPPSPQGHPPRGHRPPRVTELLPRGHGAVGGCRRARRHEKGERRRPGGIWAHGGGSRRGRPGRGGEWRGAVALPLPGSGGGARVGCRARFFLGHTRVLGVRMPWRVRMPRGRVCERVFPLPMCSVYTTWVHQTSTHVHTYIYMCIDTRAPHICTQRFIYVHMHIHTYTEFSVVGNPG